MMQEKSKKSETELTISLLGLTQEDYHMNLATTSLMLGLPISDNS